MSLPPVIKLLVQLDRLPDDRGVTSEKTSTTEVRVQIVRSVDCQLERQLRSYRGD